MRFFIPEPTNISEIAFIILTLIGLYILVTKKGSNDLGLPQSDHMNMQDSHKDSSDANGSLSY